MYWHKIEEKSLGNFEIPLQFRTRDFIVYGATINCRFEFNVSMWCAFLENLKSLIDLCFFFCECCRNA